MSHDDFDIDSLAAYLHLMPQQVVRLADRGKLPGRKVGGQWRFSHAEMHHWLEERIGLSDEEELLHFEGVLEKAHGPAPPEIVIAQMLPVEAIAIPLPARTRNSVFQAMVEKASATGWLWDPERMVEVIRTREEMFPTALDNGVALLHPRRPMSSILGQAFLALGRTSTGIPFGAGHGALTDIFFLICSVDDRGHLRTLARLSRILGSPGFLAALPPGPRRSGGARVDLQDRERVARLGIRHTPCAARNGTRRVPTTLRCNVQLSILFVGDISRAEFREAGPAARRLGDFLEAADASAAAEAIASGWTTPDLIVVAQAFPGEFSAASIERLRRLAPLARVVGLLGPWCEGETRTGKPWPAAIRVYWHQWLPRAEEEFRHLGSGQTSSWSLPTTASEEERLLLMADQPWEKRRGRVAIRSPWAEMHAWLADACRRRGYTPVPLLAAADALLFDGTDCQDHELDELARLAASVRPAPVVVLLDFPRVEDRDRAVAAGAAAVLAKPLLLEDLFWQLDAVWPAYN